VCYFFFLASRRRHTRSKRDWSSDVCSSDLRLQAQERHHHTEHLRRDAQRDPQPAGEPGLLQGEVVLDRLQLLGQRGELSVPAERSEERRVGEGSKSWWTNMYYKRKYRVVNR